MAISGNDMLTWRRSLTPERRETLARILTTREWAPASLPQIAALISPADILGYGGAAGGGKTDTLLGCALGWHRRSIIFRREATQLVGIEERALELVRGGAFNSTKHIWRLPGGRMLRFGAVQRADDWRKYQGQPHDFIGFDEAANFLEGQVRALMGWNRTTVPGQRCRVILGFNPPTSADGAWIIGFFAPWLDREHPNPALPGELRWFATLGGKDIEVEDGAPIHEKGKLVCPRSRTFIPARVEDNRFLMETGYAATLDALPEPLRSQMRHGDFLAGTEDDQWQVIPTAWVKAAQARWSATPPGPLSALGVDVARGGKDCTVLTPRHGMWFGPQTVAPGAATPDGPAVAGLVVAHLGGERCPVQVDVIGVGGSVYDHLRGMGVYAVAMNGAEGSDATDRSRQLSFANRRAEWWWKLREALDPATGDHPALPPGRDLLADLCAPRWKLVGGRIQIERKEDIISRIGRSPDRGDSLVYAHAGPDLAVWERLAD